MPKVITFENIGLKGLSTDVTPWSLPPEFMTEANNFRVFANQLIASGGWEAWEIPPESFNAGYLLHVGATTSNFWIVAGRTKVYGFDGQNWGDISSVVGYASLGPDQELDWTGCQIGQIPVINNPQIYPEYWSPVSLGQVLQPLPWVAGSSTWDDANQQCRIIRSHNNFMWALDLIDNGDEIPSGVRWSHPADINGLPPSWDETDQNFLAGKIQLGDDGGAIIDGQSLRDQFVVYSEDAINIFNFTGGEFVWNRRELSSTVGLLATQCLIEVKGTHFFLADGDVVRNNGTEINSIMHNRIRRRLTANMNTDFYQRSFAVRNNALKEIWFCVPEENSEYPNVAYIYNWQDDSWAIRDLPPNNIAHANYGTQSVPVQIWDNWDGTWAQQTRTWGGRSRTPLNDTIVGVDNATSQLYLLDPVNGPDENVITTLERTNFPLEGHPKVTTITRVYPHMSGTQQVEIELGSHDYADGPIRWKNPVMFTPGQDRKIDIRTTGELHAWRIRSNDKGVFRLSGMTIEYEDGGFR